MSDDWASGRNGYLKRDFLIGQMEEAGFEFVAASDINANESDQPTEEDIVWRLPPSLATSKEDPELKAKMEAVGESNRMTLKFRKP
jgi:predicted methyltransferase